MICIGFELQKVHNNNHFQVFLLVTTRFPSVSSIVYGCVMGLFGNQINKGKGRWFLDAFTKTEEKEK